jgi:hypothetical protein
MRQGANPQPVVAPKGCSPTKVHIPPRYFTDILPNIFKNIPKYCRRGENPHLIMASEDFETAFVKK